MLRRDLLKDQIEQLGRIFGKIVSRLLSLPQTGTTPANWLLGNE